jgi:hypothetical protein
VIISISKLSECKGDNISLKTTEDIIDVRFKDHTEKNTQSVWLNIDFNVTIGGT